MLARYEYDVFGAIRNETGTSDNTRKFTGKEFDADSNLYYYAARYYDPYIGRFTQRDPVGDGVNWYAYTYNNPLKFIDPTGRVVVPPVIWFDPEKDSFFLNDNGYVDSMTVDSIASALVDVFPFIGDIKGLRELFTGQDAITGESLSGLERWLGLFLLTEFRGVKKGTDLFPGLIDALRDLSYDIKVRITRGNQKGVKIKKPDGTVIDITPERVKEWEPEPKNPGTGLKKKKFDNPQPGSKGYKRDPTQAELDLLDKL